MNIKNILYVVIFVAFTGIKPAQAVAEAVVRYTGEQVLQEFAERTAGQNPEQKGFFGRVGDHMRTAGVYAYHVGKYPGVAAAFCLPFVMKVKNEVFSTAGNSINWIVYGALTAATAAGLYKGPGDARKQFETEAIIAQHPKAQASLALAAREVAELRNIHGTLGQLQESLARLTDQNKKSADTLEKLQENAQKAQEKLGKLTTELSEAQTKLNQLKEAGAASTALAQIDALQNSIGRHAQLVQQLAQLMQSGTDARMRVVLVSSIQGMLTAAQLCETARGGILSQVQGNGAFLTVEQQHMIEGLRSNLAPVLEGQRDLQSRAQQFLTGIQLQIQQEEQALRMREDQQKRLALEAAAAPVLVAAQESGNAQETSRLLSEAATMASRQRGSADSFSSIVLGNGFGTIPYALRIKGIQVPPLRAEGGAAAETIVEIPEEQDSQIVTVVGVGDSDPSNANDTQAKDPMKDVD